MVSTITFYLYAIATLSFTIKFARVCKFLLFARTEGMHVVIMDTGKCQWIKDKLELLTLLSWFPDKLNLILGASKAKHFRIWWSHWSYLWWECSEILCFCTT